MFGLTVDNWITIAKAIVSIGSAILSVLPLIL